MGDFNKIQAEMKAKLDELQAKADVEREKIEAEYKAQMVKVRGAFDAVKMNWDQFRAFLDYKVFGKTKKSTLALAGAVLIVIALFL